MPATATKSAKSPAKNGKAAAKSAPASPPPIDPGKAVRSAAMLLKQVSDATRLQVLLMLADGELNVGQVCSKLNQSQPAVSHHLALLRHSRLIEPRRQQKNNFYSLSDSGRRLVEAVRGLV